MATAAFARNQSIGFFSDFIPRPDASSANLRVHEIVSSLSGAGYVIKYFWWLPTQEDARYLDLSGKSVDFFRIRMDVAEAVDAVFRHKLSQIWFTNLWGIDWIRCCLMTAKAVKRLNSEITIVADTMDYHAKKYYRKFAKSGKDVDLSLADSFYEYERQLYAVVDEVVAVSPTDARDISIAFNESKSISVIGNIHASASAGASFDDRNGFVFLGNYRVTHNIDAVRWFLDFVTPHLRKYLPHAKLFLLGKHAEELPGDILYHPFVSVVGFVADIASELSRYRCMVAPVTYGAGLKGKIGSAISCGLPVVATSIGAEGYPFTNGEHAFICDEPSVFAEKCVQLHEDSCLWGKISENAIELANHSLSSRHAIEALMEIVNKCSVERVRPKTVRGAYSSRSLPEFVKVMSGASRKNRIAVIEPTLSHQETFHSLIEYCKSIGFGVDIILRSEARATRDMVHTLAEVPDTNTAFFYVLNPETVEQCVAALNSADHHAIFFNTIFEYWLQDGLMASPSWEKLQSPCVYAYMHHWTKYSTSSVRYPHIPQSNVFSLGENVSKRHNVPLLSPSHFYVDEARCQKSSGKTRFACVGGVGDQRRNYSQLIDACIALNDRGLADKYSVAIIGGDYSAGGGWVGKYQTHIRRYGLEGNINLHGEKPFNEVFTSVCTSDYLLFLIDMANPCSNEYVNDKITGSLNLSLGFGVVPVVDKQLSNSWKLDTCSVTYSGYQEFLNILLDAVQHRIPLHERRSALLEKSKRLKAVSIENFKSKILGA